MVRFWRKVLLAIIVIVVAFIASAAIPVREWPLWPQAVTPSMRELAPHPVVDESPGRDADQGALPVDSR